MRARAQTYTGVIRLDIRTNVVHKRFTVTSVQPFIYHKQPPLRGNMMLDNRLLQYQQGCSSNVSWSGLVTNSSWVDVALSCRCEYDTVLLFNVIIESFVLSSWQRFWMDSNMASWRSSGLLGVSMSTPQWVAWQQKQSIWVRADMNSLVIQKRKETTPSTYIPMDCPHSIMNLTRMKNFFYPKDY